MKKGTGFLFIIILAVFFVFFAGCTSDSDQNILDVKVPDAESADYLMQTELSVLQGEISNSIDSLMTDAEECAFYAGKEDMDSFKNRASELISENKKLIGVAYIGNDGILIDIVPESEGIAPGDSLSYQDSVALMNERKTPALTDLFELKQGGYAAAVYYPVFSGSIYEGFISLTFSPKDLFSEYAQSLKNETGFEVMALQKDGVILYDPDETETGTPTFNNPAYEDFPGIIEAAEKIVKEWSGNTGYSYYSTGTKKTVKKRQFWTTVAAGGNEWKLTVIRDIGQS